MDVSSLFSRRQLLWAAMSSAVLSADAQFKRAPGSGTPPPPQSRQTPLDDGATFRTEVRVVNILATVHDASGRIVSGLSRDDFEILDEGKPRTIQYFSNQSDTALSLGLLVDISFSQRSVLPEQKSASQQFLSEVLRPAQDKAFVIGFSHEVTLLQDLTSERAQLEKAISRLQTPEVRTQRRRQPLTGAQPFQGWPGSRLPGARRRRRPGEDAGRGSREIPEGIGTALFDAIYLAGNDVLATVPGRKAILLISDGVDFGSKVGESAAIEAAQRADAMVFSLLYKGELDSRVPARLRDRANDIAEKGKRALESLSRQTGGAMFSISNQTPLSIVFQSIQEELRNQYSLGFNADDGASGGYHRLEVRVKQKGLKVRAREGYYLRSV